MLLLLAVLLYNVVFSYSYSVGPNYRNVTIDTRVNVTNAGPEVRLIRMNDPITLTAGSPTYVECNVSVLDFNGGGDINRTEAIFYHSTSSSTASDDNNTHYTNATCTPYAQGGDWKNFTCGFQVYYYALNGTWTCNATTYDNRSYNDTKLNTTTIDALLALNVSPTLIDYGNLSVSDTSVNKSANVTNIGNVPINISVKGYGATENDGLAFVCAVGNISIANERYSINRSHSYTQKSSLQASFQQTNLTIQKQNVTGQFKTNATYWQLYVPPNPFGICNGTIVFQAELS